MKEAEFLRHFTAALGRLQWKALKTHGSEYQVGLPDHFIWRADRPLLGCEAKAASAPDQAVKKLGSEQRSVLISMSHGRDGALLVFGSTGHAGAYSGVIFIKDGDFSNHKLFFEKSAVAAADAVAHAIEARFCPTTLFEKVQSTAQNSEVSQ